MRVPAHTHMSAGSQKGEGVKGRYFLL